MIPSVLLGALRKALYIQIQAMVQEMFGVSSMKQEEHITTLGIIMQIRL